jgi:tetratricopeptide (TPR) repeat protein
MNGLAWVLATHPDRKLRDSGRAIRLAQRASELTENRDASILDTLAAAYAAADQFDQAVATAEAALGLIDDRASSDLETDLKKRLDLYRQRSPFREPGFDRVTDRPVSEQ